MLMPESIVYHTFDETGTYIGISQKVNCEKLIPAPSDTVSVIVPIYNVETTLDEALDSIQSQKHKSLEIICINDGSTDNSLDIINKHASADSRIVVIDKKNEGYGATCNKGLSVASGKWISIVEPDDWIEPDMYFDMLEMSANYPEAEIIKTPYWNINLDHASPRRENCSYRNLINPKTQPFTIAEQAELIKGHPSIWSAIYKKTFLEDNNIAFHEIPGAGWADNPFLIDTMCRANNIVWLDKPYYCYRSDTHEKLRDFHQNHYEIPFERWAEMQDIIESLGITDERILMAHYNRGFVYMAGVLEYNDASDPKIVSHLKDMFNRMDASIVLSSTTVSPGAKKLFAEIRGIEAPKTSNLAYMKKLVKSTVLNVQNNGVASTLEQVGHYLKTHGKRTGKR